MAITLDELLKEYKGPEDITGPEGLLKQQTKALIEQAMDAEMTDHLGYEKNDQAEKDTSNRPCRTSRKDGRCRYVARERQCNNSRFSTATGTVMILAVYTKYGIGSLSY
jgi:transposase-like protein